MFYLNSTLNFGIPPVQVFQLEVNYKVDRLLIGFTAQQKGTTARWYSNKTSLYNLFFALCEKKTFVPDNVKYLIYEKNILTFFMLLLLVM